jgi:hypothetical protein
MNVRSPRFWLAVISLSAVFGYAAATLTKSSPGELSASHAQDGSLTGAFSCAACHGGWVGDMTSSCLECHEDVGAQIEAGTGLHGVQAPDLARSCQLCHSEHHGPDFRMVNTASFALAGVADVAAFDHGRIGYDMAGKHLELDCTECHELAEAPMLEDGQSRYLGLDQNCASCHDDPHEGRMAIACASCHSQDAWDAWEAPDHDRYLPLQGAHGRLECAACHEPEGDLDLEVLGARAVRAYKQNCLTCHESPHREDVLTALGAAERRSLEASCGLCHEPDHESFGDERLADTVTPERHAHTGFRLEEPHAEQTCAECHGDVATGTMQFAADAPFATRYPGREQNACATCHDDVHRGEFDDSPLAPNGCVDCHATTHFDPHAFTAAMHDSTAFALTGTHTTTECRACHERTPDDGPAAFGETPSTCDECHADAHGGYFAPFAAALGARPAGETDAAENAPGPDASDTAAPDAEGNADATRRSSRTRLGPARTATRRRTSPTSSRSRSTTDASRGCRSKVPTSTPGARAATRARPSRTSSAVASAGSRTTSASTSAASPATRTRTRVNSTTPSARSRSRGARAARAATARSRSAP